MPPSWTESKSPIPAPSHELGNGEKSNTFSLGTCTQPGNTINTNIQQEPIDLITQWSCPTGNGYYTEYDAALNLMGMAQGEASQDNGESGTQIGPRRKAKPPDNPRSGLRLACPYQAYNKSQVCFNPSAQNPLGGCAGIGRLRSFDTTQQKADHEAVHSLCDARESPPSETMMSDSQESEFERLRLSGRSVASLKLDYCPYYVRSDSFMMPAMTFSNAIFPSSQAPESSPPSHPTNDGLFLHQDTGYVATSGAAQKGPSRSCGAFGGMFATPVLSSDQSVSTPSLSVDMPSRSGHWTSSPASTMPPTTNPSPPNSPRPADAVLRKNYDRLRNRHAITRKENAELREAAQQVRSSLNQIDAALEEVLNAEDLPEAVYDRVVEISSMVDSMNGKL
ncbi:hypothetical protein PG993_004769 [Apiospora rasikravindrae]|uniref:BZIP domain-containing protein n=1 Tax=Apiospora rasikravindrae TaxID=990691 RepID=A0ABR1TDP4_9PEZI